MKADLIGFSKGLDHVGIRVSSPELSWKFYAEKFGFIHDVSRYEPSPDVLKNFRPWISRYVGKIFYM